MMKFSGSSWQFRQSFDSSYLAGAIPTNQGLGIGLARANEEWNSISKVPLCQEMVLCLILRFSVRFFNLIRTVMPFAL
jgi:hypothetical protein